MSLDYSLIGVVLLVAGVIVIAIEGALAAAWSLRIGRRSRELSERLAKEQSELQAGVEHLRLGLAEMEALWQPYGRLLRWLRHPIVIALMQSLVRRGAAAR